MYLRTMYDTACKFTVLHYVWGHDSQYVELTFKCQFYNNININKGSLNALKLKADLLSNQNLNTIFVLQ
jgi:hypothetical protein